MEKQRKRQISNEKEGSILVLVLLVVLISFIIGTGLLALGTQSRVALGGGCRSGASRSGDQ